MATPKREHEETRAKRVLKLLLLGIEGTLISNVTQIDPDFRSRIRAATFATRRAVDGGTTAHAALLEHLLPVFIAVPKKRVVHGYSGEDA